MPTFKLTLAYDGTDYVGWQRQANGVSVQEVVEQALAQVEGAAVAVVGAGRTDAGVHAAGQVASCTLQRPMAPDALQRALNGLLPDDVRVIGLDDAPSAFNARFSARAKTYRYRIANAAVADPLTRRFAWHLPAALDRASLGAAIDCVLGRHDFAAFQASGSRVRTTERCIDCASVRDEHAFGARLLTIEVTGDGFLRHMVRNIVGSAVEVGVGRRSPAWMQDVLASRDRRLAGPTAPAHGLTLIAVAFE